MRIGALGPVEILRHQAGPAAITPQTGGYGRSTTTYLVALQLAGSAHLNHYGLSATLAPGDLVLLNNSAPYQFSPSEQSDLLLMRIPLRLLRSYLPSPEQYCGRPLHKGDGITESVADLVIGVWTQLEAGLEPPFHGRIARNLLDLLATAFSLSLDGGLHGSPVICDRNARVRLHIEQKLRDPDLRPSIIASDLRLSPRYLRAIFAASGETVSAYILRRRLEESARQLIDPASMNLSITDIAFGWGFNSGPHFARSFRTHFGLSPRDYRRGEVGFQEK